MDLIRPYSHWDTADLVTPTFFPSCCWVRPMALRAIAMRSPVVLKGTPLRGAGALLRCVLIGSVKYSKPSGTADLTNGRSALILLA